MEQSDQPNKQPSASPEPDAAQLLKILDLQRRARTAPPDAGLFTGMSFKYGSLAAIILGTIAAVIFLEWFAAQLPRPQRNAPASLATPGRP